MASNSIILPAPGANSSVNYSIPADASAKLNITAQDIDALKLDGQGGLVISFVNGGEVTLSNFESFVDSGKVLSLQDGTQIDPKLLFNTLDSRSDNPFPSNDTVKIGVPTEGSTREVSLVPGQKYLFDFDLSQTQSANVKDGKMIIDFGNDTKVVIANYDEAMSDKTPPELSLASKTCIVDGDELITNIQELATTTPLSETVIVLEEETSSKTKAKIADAAMSGEENVVPASKADAQNKTENKKAETADSEALAKKVAEIQPAAGDSVEAMAKELAKIETAAGGGAGNGRPRNTGRYGSEPREDPFVTNQDIGPINPTDLGYKAPLLAPSQFIAQANLLAAAPNTVLLDETDLFGGSISASGTISVDFGADGNGGINPNGSFSSNGSKAGGLLTSDGKLISVAVVGNGYVGTAAGGGKVFDLTINSVTGVYTFTQYLPLDHADGSDPNDQISLVFGITAKDGDGDQISTTLTAIIVDDAPSITGASGSVDESNLNPTATASGVVIYNYGQDGAGQLRADGIFTSGGSQKGGALTSDGVPVVVTQSGNIYTGKAGVVTVFTLTLNPLTGAFIYTQFKGLDHADNSNPNDVITLSFGVQVTDGDGDSALAPIVINVLDDVPSFPTGSPTPGHGLETVDETNLAPATSVSGVLDADFGADVPGSYSFKTGSFVASGSMTGGALTHNGAAVVVTQTGNTYTGAAGGVTVFTLTLNAATGAYTFTLLENFDHADGTNPNDIITLNFGVIAADAEGEGAEGNIVINVRDDVPSITGAAGSVDESNIGPGPVILSGAVTASFGQDGAGAIQASGSFASGGSQKAGALTSNGVAVVVTSTAGGYEGKAGGVTVFTLTLNPLTGAFVYTQFKGLDHADNSNPNDVITLTFGTKVVDFDGDSASAPIVINVLDDVPSFPTGSPTPGHGLETVDETNLAPATSVSGVLDADFGADVPGSYSFKTGSFVAGGSLTGGALTHDGDLVVVTIESGVFVGKAGGVTVFTLSLNPATGAYVFTLLENLDHADGTNPDDVITLNFGVIAADAEGEGAEGKITINVRDDAPIANDDTRFTPETTTITGNVTSNDVSGQDTPALVTKVVFNGVTTNVPASGNATIVGTFGTLTINKEGVYTYVSKVNVNGVDNFVYTLRDNDGDTDPATLSINVTDKDTTPVIVKPATEVVDETNLATGIITETGAVSANFFADGPGTFSGNGSFTSGGSRSGGALTSNGVAVVVTQAGNTYTGTAGGVTVFTMQINADGNYTFRLLEPLDHANGSDPNDIITLDFGVRATDADGDSAATTITVQVRDDAPSIAGSAGSVDESNLGPMPITVSGAVNASFGQDGAGAIQTSGSFTPGGSLKGGALTSDNVAVVVTSTAGGYQGKAGNVTVFTLTLNPATGAFVYTQFQDLDHADNNDPNDIITLTFGTKVVDFDGDSAVAPIVISVFDDGPTFDPTPVITKPANINTDETNLSGGVITETGMVTANFFTDTPGTITGNNSFTSGGSRLGGLLTSGGVPVNVTQSGNTYTGTAGGVTIFTMQILAGGAYTFKLFEQLDHADGNNPNDMIALNFGVQATDSDGDTSATTITVLVSDDAPAANPDFCTLVGAETQISSNALANDVIGQDVTGRVSSVTFGGVTTAVPLSGSANIASVYGVLTISANGNYTYKLNSTNHPVTSEEFTVTISDHDGDTSSSLLQLNMAGFTNGQVIGTGGNDTVNGGTGNDVIYGNGGDDWLYGNNGDDYIEGGTGNDIMAGDNGNDVLYGGTGNDDIEGGSGNDNLLGQAGNDILTGGSGSDQFWFLSTSDGIDRIRDFRIAESDKLELSWVLPGFDPLTDAINNFVFATHSGSDTILSVNAAGTGQAGATQMIVLDGVNVSVTDLYNSGSIVV